MKPVIGLASAAESATATADDHHGAAAALLAERLRPTEHLRG
jgi:hypothetical protein